MKTEIKWGIIFSLVSLVWVTMEFYLGYHTTKIEQHPTFTMFFILPAILMMTAGIREKKSELGGVISYKEAFLSGIIISIVVAILSPLVQVIFSNFINPNFYQTFIDYAVSHGKATKSEAEAYFNLKSYTIQSVIGAIVMGMITSAIAALFIRTKVEK
ncbi:hypothetical protein BH11BAC2_BH11BAC2_23540 [soil metagenome]